MRHEKTRFNTQVYRSKGDEQVGHIVVRRGRYVFSPFGGVEFTQQDLRQVSEKIRRMQKG